MTLSSPRRRIQYKLSGVGPYYFPFRITASTSLQVYIDDVLQGSGYTVFNVGNDTGGHILFDSTPTGSILTLLRDEPFTQTTDHVAGENWQHDAFDAEMDKGRALDLQLQELLNRVPLGPPSSGGATVAFQLPNPAGHAGEYIVVSADETKLEFNPSAATPVVLHTKGDLLAHDGTTVVRVPVGADNNMLMVDSALPGGLGYEDGLGELGVKSVQVFTTSGTWTKPSGIRMALVQVFGAGGGGGGCATTGAAQVRPASGGGGGGLAEKFIDLTGISSATVTVGAGGAGGAAGDNDGSDGGDSIWSDGTNTLTGLGGKAGQKGQLTSILFFGVGGNGSSGTGGDVNIGGEAGQYRFGNPVDAQAISGAGGRGALRLGVGGRGVNFTSDGMDATGKGAGGGGALNKASQGTNRAGGDGADGLVVVWEYD